MDRDKNKKIGLPTEPPIEVDEKPSPLDPEHFIPWACKQIQLGSNVVCETVTVGKTSAASTSAKGKKATVSKRNIKLPQESETSLELRKSKASKINEVSNSSNEFDAVGDDAAIKIILSVDNLQNIIGLRFDKAEMIPRELFKVIALILQFHPHLSTLSANSGIDQYSIYEINKLLNISMITDVCLDDTNLKNPNYYLLLENANNLTCLSISRCKIDDDILKTITDLLSYHKPCGRTLKFLNISSNNINDKGASYLADVLRTNRCLTYLNVANNRVTDSGSSQMFDTMLPFIVTNEELIQSRLERIKYLKDLEALIKTLTDDIRQVEEKKLVKRKGISTQKSPKDYLKRESLVNFESLIADKAKLSAIQSLGDFLSPFQNANTYEQNGVSYCMGNNTLICLNVAYNNLTYVSLLKLLEVLNHQKASERKPRGLLRVRLEGNYLPTSCDEYAEISILLRSCLEISERPLSMISSKKNAHMK